VHLCTVDTASGLPRLAKVSSAFVLALYGCRNPIDVWQSSLSPLTRGLFRSRPSRIQLSQLPSLSSRCRCPCRWRQPICDALVFCHNSDIVVDTYALPSGRQPVASEIGLRHLLLHCTVFAIRLTYGFGRSPRSRLGCFVPARAESVGGCLSYRRRRHLLPCAR
jgi:hypothetical protein